MRPRSLVGVLVLMILLAVPALATALPMHYFDCNACHNASIDPGALGNTSMNNMCLKCHTRGAPVPMAFNAGDPRGTKSADVYLHLQDASNALGSATAAGMAVAPTEQTSHYWASPTNVVPAAGAEAPSIDLYKTRTNITGGKVACSTCHEPHGAQDTQLLRIGKGAVLTANAMCLDCHRSWNSATTHGVVTHPMGVDYATVVTADIAQAAGDATKRKYKDAPDNGVTNGAIGLLADGTISCTTCHGVHFTDSDAATTDGIGVTFAGGDGRLLKHNGPAKETPDTSICNTCHTYTKHGNTTSGTYIGCQVCHGGHEYDAGGNPNFYMLKKQITLVTPKDGTEVTVNIDLSTPDGVDPTKPDFAGFVGVCQACHTLPGGHDVGWTCTDCHGHQDNFQASCGACHGYPPTVDGPGNTTSGGYAFELPNAQNPTGFNYAAETYYKSELNTPHKAHAGGGNDYGFVCVDCHSTFVDLTTPPHRNGNGQDVAFGALASSGMTPAPAYNTANPGTCSNVYCHSNGGARAAAPVAATIPVWTNGNGTISTCDACHGNSSLTMAAKSNSAQHQAHLNKGYTCNVCHDTTADNNTTLAAGAIGGTHINNAADVLFDTTYPLTVAGGSYAQGGGTCSVYCHSNGRVGGESTPDWDLPVSGACGTCHQVNASGDTGTALTGAHTKHVFDATGPQLLCSACHGAGADTGAQVGHLNKTIDSPAQAVCNGCHGATGGAYPDNDPVWTNATTVDCETCHVGALAVINGRTAPAKDLFGTSGHGKTGVTKVCLDCHDGAGSGHLDATAGDNRLLALGGGYSVATPEGFCAACHTGTTETDHYGNGGIGNSIDGNHCNSCHDPHGAGLDAMILSSIGGRTVVGFADKSVREDYYVVAPSAAGYGICQVCHDPTDPSAPGGDIKYFNTTTSTPGHYAGVCTDCHKHFSTTAFTPSGCNSCHGDSVTEQYWPFGSGGSIPTANDDKGRHDEHVLLIGQSLGYGSYTPTMYSDAQQKAICAFCHATPGADGDHGNVLSLPADTAFHPLWNVGAVAAGTYDTTGDVQGTCTNIACHNSKATGSSTNAGNITTFGWKDAGTATCVMCHADVTDGAVANSTGGTHVAHIAATSTYGVTVTCATCHDGGTVWNTTKPAVGHLNGTLDVNAPLSYVAGSCGTNSCHNDGTGSGAPAVTTYAWGTSEASACGICHADTPASGKHGEHVGSTTYVSGSCNDCHDTNTGNGLVAAAEPTHLNTVVNTANKVSAYSGSPAFTCTNACHTANTTDDWSLTGSLTCTDCHGSGIVTTPALDRGWPPTTVRTAAHTAHTGSSYVSANCVDCHNNNVGAHSTLDNSVTSPTLGAKISAYNTVAGTCTNTCHDDSGADFHDSTPVPVCTDCHSGTFLGGGTNMPTSGLHTGTLTVSGNTHDALFQATNGEAVPSATCITCHTATPSSAHADGTFDASIGIDAGAGQKINFVAAVNFGDGVTPTCGPSGALASCHDDGGAWGRKWSTTAQNSNGTECANCHGDFTNTWVAGIAQRHSADPELTANHAVCATCHTYIAGDITYYDPSTQHRDQIIQLNNGMSFSDDGATVSCSGCHTTPLGLADGQHSFQDTWNGDAAADGGLDRWGRVLQAGPAADCASCHASNGMTHGGTTESAALHTRHLASPYITGCTDCHTHDTGSGVDHLNDTVNFGGQMTGTANYAKAVDFGGTCAGTNGCHDSSAGNWKTETLTGACADCHASAGTLGVAAGGVYPPTSGEHSPHLGNTVKISGCTDCHTHGGAMGGDHVNTTVETGGSITGYTAGNCTTSCHTSANGDWATAGSLTCANCHNAAGNTLGAPIYATLNTNQGPTTDKHNAHTGADADYVADCATCHTHNGELGSVALGGFHVDGLQKTLVATITVNADKSCTNSCHLAATPDEWNTGSLGCTDCHTQTTKTLGAVGTALMSGTVPPATGRHDVHMNNTNYLGAGCTECHSHNGTLGTVGHVNGPNKGVIEVTNKITVTPIPADDTCTNTCHTVVVGRDWTVGAKVNGTALACADCHASAGSLGQGAWPAATNAHSPHMASNALPGAAPQNDCYACHDSTIDNTGALKPAGTHLNLTSGDLAFNGNFNYEAGTAGRAAGAAATTTCSAVLCHNGVTTPTWGAVTISCGQCHNTPGRGPIPSGSIGGSHLAHVDANDGDFADCESCHTGANSYSATGGPVTHQNLTVNLNRSYTDLDGGAGIVYAAPGTDNGTCSNVDCHYNNATPAWGAVGSTTCTSCHNNGTNNGILTNAVPAATSGIHDRHVTDAATAYVDDCNACHGVNASTGGQAGHANLSATFGNSLTGYAGGDCTTANGCHNDASGTAWVNGATLTCGDCHAATGKTLAFGNTAVNATTPPADGKHSNHMGNFYVGTAGDRCTVCHTHAGSFSVAGHADAAAAITLDTASGEQVNYTAGNCTNNCHSVAAGAWTGAVTLGCSDCHSGATYVASRPKGLATQFPPTNNGHSTHVTTGDASYGLATRKSAVGSYDFACGQCHGTVGGNHMNGSITMAAVGFSAATANACNATSCHSDGRGSNVESPIWSGTFAGDKCAGCHGNSPTSAAHGVHEIGIHAEDIYDQANSGVMTAVNGAHGERTTDNLQRTSTIITCQVCHNGTVQVSNNDKNTTCVACHTAASAKGDMVIGTYDNHVNGAADILFFNEAVKTKAQLRNDIEDPSVTEIGSNWKRMNDGLLQNLFYKGANAYDESETFLNAQATSGSGATRNCTVACHNGRVANWPTSYINPASYASDCAACHTQLPK